METSQCPNCGCPVADPSAARVESLEREVDQLRQTVALLRGSGHVPAAGRAAPGSTPQPT